MTYIIADKNSNIGEWFYKASYYGILKLVPYI